jgi:nucleoside-diphosphate-sugar epimerase
VPQLIDAGHEVIGTCKSPAKTERLRALGVEPVMLDALDAQAVRETVARVEPDAIVYQATALADMRFGRNFDRTFARGTCNHGEGIAESGLSLPAATLEPASRRWRQGQSRDSPRSSLR